jgi:hypothetical protein
MSVTCRASASWSAMFAFRSLKRRCRRPFFSLLAALVLALPLTAHAASGDPNAEANRQFVQAIQAVRRADQSYDVLEQAKLLQEAEKLFSDIVRRLPESGLAVQLTTNQFIGDFDYLAFKTKLRGLICADPRSSACLLHRIEGLMTPLEQPIQAPRWDWLSLAIAHYHIGDKERVRPIIAPFVSALRAGGIKNDISQDLFVSRTLALTGEVDLALRLTRDYEDCSTRIYNLSDIAEALLWQKETARAAAAVEEATEFARARNCAWELGLVAQGLLRIGQEDRARALFLNTVEEQFSRFKDRKGDCCPPELAVAAGDLGDPQLALGLLRTVQKDSPWAVAQVLGKLEARGEKPLTFAFAEQVEDQDIKAEALAELIKAAVRINDKPHAQTLAARLDKLATDHPKAALILAQKAKGERYLHADGRWRSSFQLALSAAEQTADPPKDMAVPLLALLVELDIGTPLLE